MGRPGSRMNVSRSLLEDAERELDNANYLFGSKSELCIYCSAKLYDGKRGVIHNDGCILLKQRKRWGR
jgi:hypothetical protein